MPARKRIWRQTQLQQGKRLRGNALISLNPPPRVLLSKKLLLRLNPRTMSRREGRDRRPSLNTRLNVSERITSSLSLLMIHPLGSLAQVARRQDADPLCQQTLHSRIPKPDVLASERKSQAQVKRRNRRKHRLRPPSCTLPSSILKWRHNASHAKKNAINS